MNVFEVLLVFLVCPLAVVGIVALLTVVPSRARARAKHPPGAGWDYTDRFYTGDTAIVVPDHLTDSPLGGARGTW